MPRGCWVGTKLMKAEPRRGSLPPAASSCSLATRLAQAAASGRPGAAYLDIPSNILMSALPDAAAAAAAEAVAAPLRALRPAPATSDVAAAAALLRGAQRPLLVVGKGAALGRAEGALQQLVEAAGLPFLATAMGRGVVPDDRCGGWVGPFGSGSKHGCVRVQLACRYSACSSARPPARLPAC